MLVAGIVSDITTWVTDAIGSYGLYAVFLLMLIDAVFPAASEVVMVYGGAVASGAFAGQAITLFGYHFESGLPAYLAVAIAGTIGFRKKTPAARKTAPYPTHARLVTNK